MVKHENNKLCKKIKRKRNKMPYIVWFHYQKKSRAGSFIERLKLLAARNSGKWGMTV